MDAFFTSYHTHRPVNATFIGAHDADDRLPDFSERGLGDLLADTRDLLRRSEDEGESSGSDTNRHEVIDRRVARGFLKIQEWELGSEHFQGGNPSLYTGEAIFGMMGLFLTDFAPASQRFEAAIARLDAVPECLRQARLNVRSAPAAWTERAIRECDGALVLFTDGAQLLAADHGAGGHHRVPATALSGFTRAAERAAQAFADHRAWLESDLMAGSHERHSAGPESFDLYLREGHFLERDAQEVLAYAEDQMALAEARLERCAVDFGAASPADALAGLRDVHPSASEYLTRYQRIWDEVREVAEAESLLTWPDFPIRYVPRPAWTRGAAPHLYFLFYRSPAAFGRPEVHDYLVAPLPDAEQEDFLRANNDSVIKLNHVIHHGGLGHHVQNWHAFRAKSRIGRMAAVDCASRIAMFCGGTMAEGWACYATDLASEAGALTPLEQYAEVHGRVRMAARAIVDVRLHHGEITLEEAATFYQERAGMTASAARGEAVKNSMFPCTALMYLMGTDGVHELRAEMTRRAGAGFDLGRFHDDFLSYGSLPVSLIAEDMKTGADRAE